MRAFSEGTRQSNQMHPVHKQHQKRKKKTKRLLSSSEFGAKKNQESDIAYTHLSLKSHGLGSATILTQNNGAAGR